MATTTKSKKSLSAKARKSMKAKSFGLPGERKYPMPDRAHASNAKSRASQQLKKGNLSRAEYDRIVRKANRKLYAGGKAPPSRKK